MASSMSSSSTNSQQSTTIIEPEAPLLGAEEQVKLKLGLKLGLTRLS